MSAVARGAEYSTYVQSTGGSDWKGVFVEERKPGASHRKAPRRRGELWMPGGCGKECAMDGFLMDGFVGLFCVVGLEFLCKGSRT